MVILNGGNEKTRGKQRELIFGLSFLELNKVGMLGPKLLSSHIKASFRNMYLTARPNYILIALNCIFDSLSPKFRKVTSKMTVFLLKNVLK